VSHRALQRAVLLENADRSGKISALADITEMRAMQTETLPHLFPLPETGVVHAIAEHPKMVPIVLSSYLKQDI
jgi:hypothetical protein